VARIADIRRILRHNFLYHETRYFKSDTPFLAVM
jgi:hypothetical protein